MYVYSTGGVRERHVILSLPELDVHPRARMVPGKAKRLINGMPNPCVTDPVLMGSVRCIICEKLSPEVLSLFGMSSNAYPRDQSIHSIHYEDITYLAGGAGGARRGRTT